MSPCCCDTAFVVQLQQTQTLRAQQSMARSRSLRSGKSFTQSMAPDQGAIVKYTASERFFGGAFFKFLTKVRWLVLLAFLAVMAVGGWLAFQIRPPGEVDRLFPPKHVLDRFQLAMDSNTGPFRSGTESATVSVDIVLGLQPPYVDQSKTSRWDSHDQGTMMVAKRQMQQLVSSSDGRRYPPLLL